MLKEIFHESFENFEITRIKSCKEPIDHYTVTGGNEAGVDVILIQPFLLYYVNHVLRYILNIIFIRKGKRFVTRSTSRSLKG